jgi:pimeloyl-ACP methyl ester carboxylesterase
LVSGLKGENDPFYFGRMAKELRALTGTTGVRDPADQRVFVVKPDSKVPYDQSNAYLDRRIQEIVAGSPPGTEFRFVGHSLGGFRLYEYLNEHPELLARTQAAVFLQTPFGGSALAEHILSGRPVSSVIRFTEAPIQNASLYGLGKVFGFFRNSLRVLTPAAAEERMQGIQDRIPEAVQTELKAKSLVFATHKAPVYGAASLIPGPSAILNLCGKALAKLKPGPNDGMVRVADQSLAQLSGRTITYPGYNHRAMSASSSHAGSFAQALWALPVIP